MPQNSPTHPKGTRARVLLSSVFGPYAQDDEFGSRAINPMELYHNQVTRAQGAFSLRMFHRSWGIMMIQSNISAPCTLLDFPTREAFARELRSHGLRCRGDFLDHRECGQGAGNVPHRARALAAIRRLSSAATSPRFPGIEKIVDADHYVRGEGISWMRRYLGEDESAPIQHPEIVSGLQTRSLGMTLPERRGSTAATIIPSVGCPMGCNFCTTSSFFGGKGNFYNFYETGDELFDTDGRFRNVHECADVFHHGRKFPAASQARHAAAGTDEGRGARAGEWRYSLPRMPFANIRCRNSWSWASPGSGWAWNRRTRATRKLKGTDTHELTRELRSHGIRVQGSTIIGLEHHTPDNIDEEIEHAVSHETDFHQFMLYTPVPGTPLYFEMKEQGRLLDDVDLADIHGQFQFNFQHAAISREDSKRFLDWAFLRDFERNGPSLYRMCQTMLQGWQRYRDYPDPRVRERFEREMSKLRSGYNAALWAMERQFRRVERNCERADQSAARRKWKKSVGSRASERAGAWAAVAVDIAARGTAAGEGKNLRAADVSGADELGDGLRMPCARV